MELVVSGVFNLVACICCMHLHVVGVHALVVELVSPGLHAGSGHGVQLVSALVCMQEVVMDN